MASSGTPSWNNVNNAKVEDGSYAEVPSANMPDQQVSGWLLATNFDFAGAGVVAVDTIDGIYVRIKRDATRSGMEDNDVNLWWSGSSQGNNKAATGVGWPNPSGTFAFATYGGAADTWGASPTGSNVIDTTFGVGIIGVGIRAYNNNGVLNSRPEIDFMEMTVYYTEVGVGPEFFAQVVGLLPIFLQRLVLPLFCRRRSVTRRAGSVSYF
jgi:hypothetical protein